MRNSMRCCAITKERRLLHQSDGFVPSRTSRRTVQTAIRRSPLPERRGRNPRPTVQQDRFDKIARCFSNNVMKIPAQLFVPLTIVSLLTGCETGGLLSRKGGGGGPYH